MQASQIKQLLASLGVLLILVISGGCASPVPGQAGKLSGPRLRVTMTFNGPMVPDYYYYFVINYAKNASGYGSGSQDANGPIPVLDTALPTGGYGNGFATGSASSNTIPGGPTDYGLTDYVLYHAGQPNNGYLGVYHYTGNPNVTNPGTYQGAPPTFQLPDIQNAANDIPGSETLTFDLPLSQLAIDPNGNPYTSLTTPTVTQVVNSMQFLQVNIIATNNVPIAQTPSNKEVDSFGNTLTSTGQSSFLVIDATKTATTYTNQNAPPVLAEPTNDVYPCANCNPNIDLVSWSVQVVNTGG